MQLHETKIPGLFVATTIPRTDVRGSFARLFCMEELAKVLHGRSIVQMNHSKSVTLGAVRGLHFQNSPHAEMKLVRCLKGKVWDVAVDLRPGSPTQFQWHAEELSCENHNMFIIPEGFAHGFQVLSPDSELLYLHTAPYMPSSEGGIHPLDDTLNIAWPLSITQLSEKDEKLSHLRVSHALPPLYT